MKSEEVVIIGAGPAGITAAIQLKRYRIPFVLLEKERVGGLLWNANLVENYPGFPAGVRGPKLIRLIEKQMERIGVQVTRETVVNVTRRDGGFLVKTESAAYRPRFVVVASGTQARALPIDIPENTKNRVFSEVLPLLDVYDKRIVIVGAGDAAFDYALNLTKNRNSVTILNRGRDVKCLELLRERVLCEPTILYRVEAPLRSVELEEIPSERGGETASMLEVRLDTGESISADYLLFAIGRVSQKNFLSDELAHKAVQGLYFAGDVKNGLYRQATIAAGDGLRTAMDIYFILNMEAKSL